MTSDRDMEEARRPTVKTLLECEGMNREDLEEEIQEREYLVRYVLVGSLYPKILVGEIVQLREMQGD